MGLGRGQTTLKYYLYVTQKKSVLRFTKSVLDNFYIHGYYMNIARQYSPQVHNYKSYYIVRKQHTIMRLNL